MKVEVEMGGVSTGPGTPQMAGARQQLAEARPTCPWLRGKQCTHAWGRTGATSSCWLSHPGKATTGVTTVLPPASAGQREPGGVL